MHLISQRGSRLCRPMRGGGSAPPEVVHPNHSGLRPALGRSPSVKSEFPEGHSPSAHRAAQPQTVLTLTADSLSKFAGQPELPA